MSLPRTVAEVLREHVTLEVECIDRMYLNGYVPGLQYESGVASSVRQPSRRGPAHASRLVSRPWSRRLAWATRSSVC